jgi:hypothetical protein
MATDDELKASYQALAKSYDALAKEADDVEQSGLHLSGSEPPQGGASYFGQYLAPAPPPRQSSAPAGTGSSRG